MEHKVLSNETRRKLQAQIAAIRQEMQYAANDLEYETHLHAVRALENLLKRR